MTNSAIEKAETAFLEWACGRATCAEFRDALAHCCLLADIRAAQDSSRLECVDILTGETFILCY